MDYAPDRRRYKRLRPCGLVHLAYLNAWHLVLRTSCQKPFRWNERQWLFTVRQTANKAMPQLSNRKPYSGKEGAVMPHFSPKAIMKSWRPERFSDSTHNDRHPLNASILEYHLSVLTAHNKDTEFERFAKAVAERAICPNLLPQTGPTGGGDAKVDTENYPVAPQLTLAWYFGVPNASQERWGFAFSAKKDWKPKAKSDIRKIAATGRGYTKAFFVSNQLISDREAAAIQDELSVELGMEVRVLGLLWLTQEVFSKKMEALAIETLGLDLPTEKIRIEGPNDAARLNLLERLEASIQAAVKDGTLNPDLVNDCIEAARLSRELEQSRDEIDGRYERAKRLAKQCGTHAQKIISLYQHAWATYHWNEDFEAFGKMYDEFEELTKASNNAAHLELLNNLWSLAFTLAKLKIGAHGEELLGKRTITLAQSLERVSRIAEMPSSSLQAKAMMLIQNMMVTLPSVPTNVFSDLQDVVRKSGELIGFPFESLVTVIGLFDRTLGDLPEFEELHDVLVTTLASRSGQAEAATLNLKRAVSRLESGKAYDAISLVGRSLVGLSQHEHRETLISALNLIAHAYESVGLLWAARGAMLNSICIVIGEFETHADTSRIRSGLLGHMKWLELQLGRLPQCLEWAHFAAASTNAFGDNLTEEERAMEWMSFDTGLGLLCLRADLVQLNKLTAMPEVFSNFGLEIAHASLLFALGHEDDFHRQIAREGDGPDEVFSLLASQPIGESIPKTFVCDSEGCVVFFSQIWGCRISISTPVESPFIELAESILASGEAILATVGRHRVVAMTPTFVITIQPSECERFEFECDTANSMIIKCGRFDSRRQKPEEGGEVQSRLTELIIHVFCRAFTGADILKTAEHLFRNEVAIDRGRAWMTSFVALANVLGDKPKTSLASLVDGSERIFPLQRTVQWKPKVNRDEQVHPKGARSAGDKETTPSMEDAHQRDIEVDSLISLTDWDAAKWKGTAFSFDPSQGGLPILALIFEDGAAARRIFEHWHSELGRDDIEERIRIVVIKGVSRSNPHSYRVAVSANPKVNLTASNSKFFTLMVRMNTMKPTNQQNLTTFLSLFGHFEKYGLTWAGWDGIGAEAHFESVIIKRDLLIRNAWEIGRQDQDCVTIQENDDPVIPVGVNDPPIADLLKEIRARANR